MDGETTSQFTGIIRSGIGATLFLFIFFFLLVLQNLFALTHTNTLLQGITTDAGILAVIVLSLEQTKSECLKAYIRKVSFALLTKSFDYE